MIRKPAAILLVLSLAVLALALVPAAGLAAKGGNGGDTSTTAAWVSVSPNPAPTYSRVDLDGCGFEVKPVQVRIVHSAGYTEVYGAASGAPDVLTPTSLPQEPGTCGRGVAELRKQEAGTLVAGIDGSDRHLAQKEQLAESPGPRPATWAAARRQGPTSSGGRLIPRSDDEPSESWLVARISRIGTRLESRVRMPSNERTYR